MLRLTRGQILAFRRRVGALDERLPAGADSLRTAAWCGLQDSMPRAALLSLHSRVEDVHQATLDDPSLAQLWGPRYSTYVVAKQDFALFSLGRLPDDTKGRERAERTARLVLDAVGRARLTDREVGRALGIGNSLRYSATTGRIAIRWEGARAPLVWAVPPPDIGAAEAQRELARRHLRVFGPTTSTRFARWAGVSRRAAAATYASLEPELVTVRTPLGDEWLLATDEPLMRSGAGESTRLLPSGDAYFLLDGVERELLVPDAKYRPKLWTPRVWPGALLVAGEIRGTWRRARHAMQIEAWARLSRGERDAVEAEAAALPLPGVGRAIDVDWR
jgi:hypothetical protein